MEPSFNPHSEAVNNLQAFDSQSAAPSKRTDSDTIEKTDQSRPKKVSFEQKAWTDAKIQRFSADNMSDWYDQLFSNDKLWLDWVATDAKAVANEIKMEREAKKAEAHKLKMEAIFRESLHKPLDENHAAA